MTFEQILPVLVLLANIVILIAAVVGIVLFTKYVRSRKETKQDLKSRVESLEKEISAIKNR
ncbi:DUF5320 domain-containing protein [Aquibacillus sediminis]|uniref:DUF5320 domain-containing protein n=1 Tax=Aquibacillus sediminis TaxID=2574734 RepID=UPI00110980C0|nr:DUF5320 domain-containing protein [Aquibacillus sediminis]